MSMDRLNTVGPDKAPKVDVKHPAAASDPLVEGVYWTMGQTSEEVARQFNMTREKQDFYALHSQQRALAAQTRGVFKDELSGLCCVYVFSAA